MLPFKYFNQVRDLFTFNLISQLATSDKTNKESSFFEFQLGEENILHLEMRS